MNNNKRRRLFESAGRFIRKNISIINAITLMFTFVSSSFLFYKQLTVQSNSMLYYSDLVEHLRIAINNKFAYSLVLKIMGILWNCTKNKVSIAIFLGLVVTFTIITISLFIRKHIKVSYNKAIRIKILLIPSFLSLFIAAIYIPLLNTVVAQEWGIYHTISAQLWHNSTYLAMRLMAPLVLVFYYQFYINKEIRIKDWLLFVIILSITNAFKPSFFMAFAPSVLFVLIFDFIRKRGRNLLFSLKIGLGVLCSMPVIIYQSYVSFGNTDSGVKLSFERINEMIFSEHSYIWILANLAFPLLVLFLSIKKREINRGYVFSWIMFIVSWLISLFVLETGWGASHGNFGWQNPLTALFLFITSAVNLVFMYKKNKIGKRLYIVSLCILSLHILCGLNYYRVLLLGADYMY